MLRLIALIVLLLPAIAFPEPEPSAAHVWERAVYGDIPGITHVTLEGYNGGPTTTYELLRPDSVAYTVRAAVMTTPYCASDSASDTAAGTGARTLTVSGVTYTSALPFVAFSETVTLNGTTSVNLATTNVLGINSVVVATAGSGGVNAGVIDCGTGANTGGSAAVPESTIPIGFNKSVGFLYTVPDNYSLVCDGFSVSSDQTAAVYTFALDTSVNLGLKQRKQIGYFAAGGAARLFKFAEKTQIMGLVLEASATDPVSASMECVLIYDTWENTAQMLF